MQQNQIVLIALFSALILVIFVGAALLQSTTYKSQDCFNNGYTAQIEKTGKTYCCKINDNDRIINCTKKDTSA